MSEIDNHPDKIFVRDHFTDFEKLLFAQAEIKDLKKENADLKIEIGKLQSFITEIEDMTDEKLRNDFKSIKAQNVKLRDEIKRLREINKKP